MNETELAWAAGLIEGEGSFSLQVNKGRYRYARITVHMADRDVLERLAGTLGGKVNGPYRFGPNPNRRPMFTWRASGSRAVELMRMLRPYMGERRTQKINDLLQEVAA